jgi:ABC-2 type transport system ATP-binding protein
VTATETDPALIEIRHLVKRFGSVQAVEDLDFTVEPGRVTGFLGPNGAGKTTTLRMLLGLVIPPSGTATIGGRPYRDLDAPVRRVGAVLEATSFHPARRARDHLRMIAMGAGIPATRVAEVLELVGLSDAAHRRVGGFSLGMRQRLELAGAMMGDPQVLILDEPANGLDPQGIAWLREFLRYLAGQGRTVLVSSHLLAEMAQTVDDVVIISGGRLQIHAPLSTLYDQVRSSMRVRSPERERLEQVLTAAGLTVRRQSEEVLLVDDVTPEILGPLLATNQIVVYELVGEGGDLESLFLSLTTSLGEAPSQIPASAVPPDPPQLA